MLTNHHCWIWGLLAGALMTLPVQAGELAELSARANPGFAAPSESRLTPESGAAFQPVPVGMRDLSRLSWLDAPGFAEALHERVLQPPPRLALAWEFKAPPVLTFDDGRVRAQPSFALPEPTVSAGLLQSISSPRWLSGSFDSPRALFFFDPPPAVSFAAIQPIPEPSTWALMLAGLGVVALAARRRSADAHGQDLSRVAQ